MQRVSPLISQVAFCSQASGALFNIAGVLEGFHEACPARVSFPVRVLLLSIFRWFSLGGFQSIIESARVARTVLMRGSNHLPSG